MRMESFTRRSVSGRRERHELVTRGGFVLVAVDVQPGRPARWHGVAPLTVPDGTEWRIRALEPESSEQPEPEPVAAEQPRPVAVYNGD